MKEKKESPKPKATAEKLPIENLSMMGNLFSTKKKKK